MSEALYEIKDVYLQALNHFTDPDIDIPEQAVADTLQAIEGEFKDKAENCVKYLRNLEVTADAIGEAIIKQAARRKAIEKRIDWLKGYVLRNMQDADMSKIECADFSLSVAKKPASVAIEDIDYLPKKYLKVTLQIYADELAKIDPKGNLTDSVKAIAPSKSKIKSDIQADIEVSGAKLITDGKRLSIKG